MSPAPTKADAIQQAVDEVTFYPSISVLMGQVLAELPAIGKNSQMTEGARYKYRGIEDVINALNPILSAKGVHVAPVDVTVVSETQRTSSNNKVLHNVRLVVHYEWRGPAGDALAAAGCGEATDSGDKAVQKAMTSAFKYMLFETLMISTEEGGEADIDRYSSSEQESIPAPPPPEPLEGWDTIEQQEAEHETYRVGLAALPSAQSQYMKARRRELNIPWPCSKAEMDTLCAEVEAMRANEFGAADQEPAPVE